MLDIVLVMARYRTVITWSVAVCGAVALMIALFSSSQYTSWAKVIREVESDAMSRGMGSGLSLLSGFGLNLGGASTGLTAAAYPDIALSREVRLAVVRDTFFFPDEAQSMTFAAYTALDPGLGEVLYDYTVGLPRTLKRALRRRLIAPGATGGQVLEQYPTRDEEEAMKAVAELVSIGVDEETGLMTLAARTDNPLLSAQLAQSFVDHLVDRVRTIRTQKARADLRFVEQQFEAAEDSLRLAENRLAAFDDRNMNPQSARLRTERDRLLRIVSFKSELYSDLQAQLTQAEIDLQRSEPIITVLEQPVPPMESSGPQRTLTLIIGVVAGLFIGVCLAFFRSFLDHQKSDAAERTKLEEIQRAFSLRGLMRRLPFRGRRNEATER